MAFLTDEQVANIKEHMISDPSMLTIAWKARKKPYDECSVSYNEAEIRKANGWEEIVALKTKVKLQKPKAIGRAFEDKIWSLFYSLGFKIINRDEHLVIKWGNGDGDHKQVDVLAVSDEAIFVVECKAASKPTQCSFKSIIDEIEHHKEGVIKSVRQIYGNKKVKFILATENYVVGEADSKRLDERKIFHLNDKAYRYIDSLIKSYKTSVTYQFFSLMFKNELISGERIRVPALKGKMGTHDYYIMSIEPELLLKMGFVLHRTKVNDSMAPTYQRLLSAKRIPGITKFIDAGGYFPNSLIVNFDGVGTKKMRIQFEPSSSDTDDSNSKLGILSIPNAYGIAYIIDGQHRLYGYAGSEKKKKDTIPVVAFVDMESREQLQIFMDINENQKAVSKSLRLDLEEDIYWESKQVDSRMKALRSSIVKGLAVDSSSVLCGKISVGEDVSVLSLDFFNKGLQKSSLLPKATKQSFSADLDVCMYDIRNQNHDNEMKECKKRVISYLRECFNYMQREIDEALFNDYLGTNNRGVFAFTSLVGTINKHLVQNGKIGQFDSLSDRMKAVTPYLDVLCDYLSNLPAADESTLKFIRGQQAETTWMRYFQKAIKSKYPDYDPDGLTTWLESQDAGLQSKGKDHYEKIFDILKSSVLDKMEQLHGAIWESQVADIKQACYGRVLASEGADVDWQNVVWEDAIELADLKTIIEKNWSQTTAATPGFVPFSKEFAIKVNNNFSTKAERLAWLSDLIKFKKIIDDKNKKLTPVQVDEMELIYGQLSPEN